MVHGIGECKNHNSVGNRALKNNSSRQKRSRSVRNAQTENLSRQRLIPDMCILFMLYRPSAVRGGYQLIVASNRDEVFNRPTRPAQLWEDGSGIIAGAAFI